ncbi:hypothetical protein DES45_11337 [Microvirga subterranea]|uniref:Uncharacterized protein n=2 Tax=Microvirga subterranea TaxID=186651 RepID=A0A370H9Y2_9HYPH|nr:hypothetical protein DES45_11337 [Microvirga subterranea]
MLPEDEAPSLDGCRDQIEQKVVRAYVQLAVLPDDDDGSCTVTVERFGSLEVRLTETPRRGPTNLPWFWLELYSHGRGSVIDSLGCYEFDEDELMAAVEFIREARRRHGSCH